MTGNGHEFEQITVLSTTPIKNGFIAELDIGIPNSLVELNHLTPIVYGGISLRGESEKVYFTRNPNSTIVKLLNCSTDLRWINAKAPVCQEIPLSDLCKEGLMMDNIDKILEGCHFTYSKPPIAIRLLDEGILVQGENLTVTEDGRAIYESLNMKLVLIMKYDTRVSRKYKRLRRLKLSTETSCIVKMV